MLTIRKMFGILLTANRKKGGKKEKRLKGNIYIAFFIMLFSKITYNMIVIMQI